MKIIFDITGMNCAACSNRIEKCVSSLKGVIKANVNLIQNNMSVDFDDNLINISQIISAVENIGYGIFIHEKNDKNLDNTEYKIMRNRVIYSFVFAIPLFYISMSEMLKFPLPNIILEKTDFFALIQLFLLLPIVLINFKYFKAVSNHYSKNHQIWTL